MVFQKKLGGGIGSERSGPWLSGGCVVCGVEFRQLMVEEQGLVRRHCGPEVGCKRHSAEFQGVFDKYQNT